MTALAAPADQADHAHFSLGQLVAIITARLPSHTRVGIGLAVRRDSFEGRFHRLSLNSVFQPIQASTSGEVLGHEAFVRCGEDRGLSPWSLFSLAAGNADADWLVALDRLCRTLHAANYFTAAAPTQRLFLSVQPGLVAAVARDHGAVFAGILRLMGIASQRVVIQLPGSINGDAASLLPVAESFLARGFGLALQHTGHASVALAAALGAPVFIKICPARLRRPTALGRVVADCRQHGLTTIVKNLGTADEASRARAAGADFLQGFAIGRPDRSVATRR